MGEESKNGANSNDVLEGCCFEAGYIDCLPVHKARSMSMSGDQGLTSNLEAFI